MPATPATSNRPYVYVTRRLPQPALELLARHVQLTLWPGEQPPPRAVLLKEAPALNGLLTLPADRVDAALLDAAPALRVVSNCAPMYDNIDIAAATAHGVLVTNTPDIATNTCADFTLALILAAARRMGEGVQQLKAGQWRGSAEPLLGRDVYGTTLGIIGMGQVGQAVARRAHGFGMPIVYADVQRMPAIERATGARQLPLEALLASSDIVSLHCPLTDDTYQLIDRDALALLKPDAMLINTAHGQLVDTHALTEMLRARPVLLAALDTTDPFPLPAGHLLLSLPNALLTPQIASATEQTHTRMALLAAQNLLDALHNTCPRCLVNTELWGTRAIEVGSL